MDQESKLVVAYGRQLIKLELEAARYDRSHPPHHAPVLDYVRSTPNRRWFCLHAVLATIDREPITPSHIAKELGVSRNSVDTMICECEEQEWIIVDRDDRGHRTFQSSPFMVECWLLYAKWTAEKSNELGFGNIEGALRLIKSLPK